MTARAFFAIVHARLFAERRSGLMELLKVQSKKIGLLENPLER